jgi:hypothetical protein
MAPDERSTPGIRGRLISSSYAREGVYDLEGAEAAPPRLRHAFEEWWRRCEASLGPASSVRAVADVALVPLLRLLGFTVTRRREEELRCVLHLEATNTCGIVAVAVPWGASLSAVRRSLLAEAIASDAQWCLCSNGMRLRIVDGRRTWSRQYLEFEAAVLAHEPTTQSLLWTLARATSMAMTPTVLDRAAVLSARHGVEVCRALGAGVLDALRLLLAALARRARRRYPPDVLFEHSLTMLYRILFLLFAEGRGLVPMWDPLYRQRYSIGAIVDALLCGRRYRGLWLAIRAISRLAHAGCAAGELRVTAFNGRLFSPSQATVFDRTRLDDDCLGQAVIAVSTTMRGGSRARIAYHDLDVEQLGAVYERVLDYQPAAAGGAPLVRTGDRRKATGTFYTPREVTSALVRRTLDPLISGRSADQILGLRILDPAMGSGAFLVAACRYLSAAVEDALLAEGRWSAHDVTAGDRVALRRQIASQCLFGVDLNPMAVQLARLSIWLATLSADKPLSFLDHHLVAGDSLVGATPADVARQPSRGGSRQRRAVPLPLLDDAAVAATLGESAALRLKLAADPDDTAPAVRRKEQTLAALQDRDAAVGRCRRVLDLWCAGWFWEEGAPPDRGAFGALVDELLHRRPALPQQIAAPMLGHADLLASHYRFLHWPMAFPEIFVDAAGQPLPEPGFDAVVGNPPWDMVRGDSGDDELRRGRRDAAQQLTNFVRESGIYRVETRAHANRYQLFLERALQLVRRGGRIGLVLPSGVVSDAGTAPLRRHLFDRAEVDEITGCDNRAGIFPIHRSVRFVLLTCTTGRPTSHIRCRFGMSDPEALERPDPAGGAPLVLSRRFLARLSGEDDLGIPELPGEADLKLCERISASVPRLSSSDGWAIHFGRELNASDDREAFEPFSGDRQARPIVEGKQIEPFRVALDRARQQLRAGVDLRGRAPRRARLAYRDVASATNRLTLIAAVLPPRAVTTHTVFCLKTPLPEPTQHVLCALMNSYVANYLIRFRVNTHVTAALVSRLRVPLVRLGDPAFDRLADLSRTLAVGTTSSEESEEYAQLQAEVAKLYALTPDDFQHILTTFPLVPVATKTAALGRLKALYEYDTPRH